MKANTLLLNQSEARGEPVDKYEVYKYTHTKHHDGVTWLNDRAREASESYLRRQEEALRNGEQFDSNSALYDALGGHDKRQKVFGMGAMANLWERPVRRGKSAASSSSSMTQEEADSLKLHVVGLTEQLESANSRVGSLETELQGTRHELEGAKRHMEERFRMMEAMMAQAGIFNMPASTSRTSPESSAPDTSTPTLPPRPPPHPDPDTQADQDL